MKAEFFKAVCPLEIGDTVAIRLAEKGILPAARLRGNHTGSSRTAQGHRYCNTSLSEKR